MQKRKIVKKVFLYIMGVAYILAGINHFVVPDMYLKIMPEYLPFHFALVILSGLCEIILGFLLMLRATSRLAAWGIIFLLIAIFPANIQMAVDYYQTNNPDLWIALVRLPLQFVLIWWAYLYARKKNFVFERNQ